MNEEKIKNVFGYTLKVLRAKNKAMIFPMFLGFEKEHSIINIKSNGEITKIDFILKEVENEIILLNLNFEQKLRFDISRLDFGKIRIYNQIGSYSEFEVHDLMQVNDLKEYFL